MPKISILIANFNNGHFFHDAFQSLVAQTEKDWEAIVIDDCSTDNSVEIIREFIKDDPRFRFYQNETNLGYQKTIIKGIELSSAEIFGRLDPDDALVSDAIEESLKAHIENPDCGLVYSNRWQCDENLEKISITKLNQIAPFDKNFWNLRTSISHFATFKKEFYKKTSGIDTYIKRAEDADIYMKMVEIAPVKYIDKELYLYRVHPKGLSTFRKCRKSPFLALGSHY
ncbi:MAG: glycosyltransferase [Bergeyella zoohelcum]|nr:glycosyltransferase [Bergeyella zoohelcum]